ncbi:MULTISPECIES: ABC transporter ATP-binding protein [Streptomyces]|uniref:ATPase n=1 Tax=Streptomyces dengpaensis TaxID=2049881 RepID=A0ABM6SWB9_9ACTN|nr:MULTISPECIES: ABC transporter ATP-binding protein [Streptomyces]AVH59000.1 ATPase [Streptomyces dengpaensis]PIB05926.1 ATPase [Streptomyces sp. HG99]
MIRFEDVSVTYDGAAEPTVQGVDFEVPEGELVLLVGPSGVGKSTVLGAVSGLVPHFTGGTLRGRVTVAGRDTRTHKPRELADVVGTVGQDPLSHFVTDTVEDELAYGMESLGLAPDVMRRRVEETLDLLSLTDLRDRPIATLSGGQQQRVAIGSVLTPHPRVLVLDEPTSALDPAAAEEVLAVLQRLVHDLGTTVLMAEHRLERVIQYADQLVLLPSPGAAPLLGTPSEVMVVSPVYPPVVDLGRLAGWSPLPLTVRDARRGAGALRERLAVAAREAAPAPGTAANPRVLADNREPAPHTTSPGRQGRPHQTTTPGTTPSTAVAPRACTDARDAAATSSTTTGTSGAPADTPAGLPTSALPTAPPRPTSLLTRLLRKRTSGTPSAPGDSGTPGTPDTTRPAHIAAVASLAVRRDRVEALRRVDLTVAPGETIALMGRNGAGKSTLLGALVGLVEPAAGSVRVGGAVPHRTAPRELVRRVGLVPQEPRDLLYADTVAAECAAADRDAGAAAGTCRALVSELLPGIGDGTHPRDLSEGQRLALALAVVLTARPPLLLLDEPTRGLDYAAKARLVTVLRGLAAEGHAIVLATHDVELAADLAHRVVILADGEIVADGPTAEVVVASPSFAPQVAKVLAPQPWLTVAQVRDALS